MASTFDVTPAELRTGAAGLGSDTSDLRTAAVSATAAITSAAGGVPGGPLAGALATLDGEVEQRCSAMASAVMGAGGTLSANAMRYEGDDAGAAGTLNAQMSAGDRVPL